MAEPASENPSLVKAANAKECGPPQNEYLEHEESNAEVKTLDARKKPKSNGISAEEEPKSLSKNQQKKLKRKQEWEEGREARKVRRREKHKARKEKHRATATNEPAAQIADERDLRAPDYGSARGFQDRKQATKAVQLPITFIIDCQFDNLMTDNERTSLSSQLTRCYSDNKRAAFRAHLAISSFGGRLKEERFDTVLNRNYEQWHGVRFSGEGFAHVAAEAESWMKDPKSGGKIAGALTSSEELGNNESPESPAEEKIIHPKGETIYLSSESPNTLNALKPYSTYIIGGLVDKNRHKGVCYKRALDRGIKTAQLPIGHYMKMQTRSVLTTNHVNEIMLKWLECGNWGEAFMHVMPKRKGGVLKNDTGPIKTRDQSNNEGVPDEVTGKEDEEEHEDEQVAESASSDEDNPANDEEDKIVAAGVTRHAEEIQ